MAATSNAVVFIVILAITFSSSSAVTETQAPSPPALTCTEELVMFSPCLPYVSAPPNNISDAPDPLCCSAFSTSVNSGAGNCLCYLLRQPMILGFPLDRSRLLSLSQICSDLSSDESFESICSPSGDKASASSPSFAISREAAGISPTSDQPSPETDSLSSTPESIINGSPKITSFCFLSTIIMTLPTSIFTRI